MAGGPRAGLPADGEGGCFLRVTASRRFRRMPQDRGPRSAERVQGTPREGSMFVVLVHYVKPLEEIDAHLAAHRQFLEEGYSRGYLLASGPRTPRTGGVILARAPSAEELSAYLARDPFLLAGVARYEVLEFTPVKCDPRLTAILNP